MMKGFWKPHLVMTDITDVIKFYMEKNRITHVILRNKHDYITLCGSALYMSCGYINNEQCERSPRTVANANYQRYKSLRSKLKIDHYFMKPRWRSTLKTLHYSNTFYYKNGEKQHCVFIRSGGPHNAKTGSDEYDSVHLGLEEYMNMHDEVFIYNRNEKARKFLLDLAKLYEEPRE